MEKPKRNNSLEHDLCVFSVSQGFNILTNLIEIDTLETCLHVLSAIAIPFVVLKLYPIPLCILLCSINFRSRAFSYSIIYLKFPVQSDPKALLRDASDSYKMQSIHTKCNHTQRVFKCHQLAHSYNHNYVHNPCSDLS